jgi:hypothetical protein
MQAPINTDNGKYNQPTPQQLINITGTQKQDIADRSTSINRVLMSFRQ